MGENRSPTDPAGPAATLGPRRRCWRSRVEFSAALIAFSLSLVLQPFVIFALRRHSIVDHPGERTSHAVPTPRGGGIAVLAGVLAGSLVALETPLTVAAFLTVLLTGAVGLAEDLKGISPMVRLAAQSVCALPIVWISSQSGSLPVVAFLIVGVVFVVGAVNAVNFMDGINGITAAVGIGAGAAYAWLFANAGEPALATMAVALTFACIAFLPFNAVRARVFLGDCGSYGVGAVLGSLAVAAWGLGLPAEAAFAPLAVYIADTTFTMFRRWRAGETWYEPHRSHVYQRLTDLRLAHWLVSLLVFALVIVTSVLGQFAAVGGGARLLADLAIAAIVVIYLYLPRVFGVNEKTHHVVDDRGNAANR